uniref:Uncharacterized protein n=1 Tax=Ditylenchus dipsaci TaxID=166011 RepID=A0A915EBV4_9BILA
MELDLRSRTLASNSQNCFLNLIEEVQKSKSRLETKNSKLQMSELAIHLTTALDNDFKRDFPSARKAAPILESIHYSHDLHGTLIAPYMAKPLKKKNTPFCGQYY